VKDLLVRRVYTKYGINVVLEIDYVKKQVSLVEKDGTPKNWKFAERTPEYFNGWRAIMLAMEYAVAEVQKEFEAIKEKEHKEFAELYMSLDKALKKGQGDPESEN
jgi:hypothetical protein